MAALDAPGLGRTIRTWRDRLSPAAVGLRVGRTRRTTGLRREELADLAGLSVDYVVRLEQGRATTPSAAVVVALARALQLTGPERDHLHRLAGLAAPGDSTIPRHIPPGVNRVLTRLADTAVAVFAADWQLIWCNRGWACLLGDPLTAPPARRNFARDRFPVDGSPPCLARWPVVESAASDADRAVVADLRRAQGRFPGDDELSALIEELGTGNARFAELWAHGTVVAHREDSKTIEHPTVGPVTVNCDVLGDGDSELKIVIMTAEPSSDDETRLRLASVTGPPETTPGDHEHDHANDQSGLANDLITRF